MEFRGELYEVSSASIISEELQDELLEVILELRILMNLCEFTKFLFTDEISSVGGGWLNHL